MIRKAPLLAVTFALLSAGVVFLAGAPDGPEGGASRSSGGLGQQCTSSVGKEGHGTVFVSDHLVLRGGEVEIPVPCELVLRRGGAVTFDGVRVDTNGLSIRDDGPNGPTRVHMTGAHLSAPRPGLAVSLDDPEDALSVLDSTLEFPMGVLATSGSVELTRSVVRAMDPATGGIAIAAQRSGTATDVTFEVADGAEAFLLAATCRLERVTGFPDLCSLG